MLKFSAGQMIGAAAYRQRNPMINLFQSHCPKASGKEASSCHTDCKNLLPAQQPTSVLVCKALFIFLALTPCPPSVNIPHDFLLTASGTSRRPAFLQSLLRPSLPEIALCPISEESQNQDSPALCFAHRPPWRGPSETADSLGVRRHAQIARPSLSSGTNG